MRRLSALLLTLAAAAAPAWAQPVSYQGRFTDNGQVPSGQYELRFTVYPTQSGGTALGSVLTRSVSLQTSDDGVFSFQDLDFGPGVFTGPVRWLEIAVSKNGGAFTVLSPRQPLNPAPQAIYAQNSGTTLQQAYDNGPVVQTGAQPLRVLGSVAVGNPSTHGLFQLFQNGTPQPVIAMYNNSAQGGSIRIRDEAGTEVAQVEADFHGTGGYLRVVGAGGALLFDGDVGAAAGSIFSITGLSSGLTLNTALTGDGALVLPARSVGPDELFAAPGIANNFRNQNVAVGATSTTVTSRSITVPGPGYVVVIGTANIGVQRASNADGLLAMAVSEVANTVPFTTRVVLRMPRSALTFGQYDFPGASHGVFDVPAAGQYTFYLNASATGFGNATIGNPQLTLIYIPTTYGEVVPNMMDNQPGPTVAAPLSNEQILAEQIAEQRRAIEQLRAEQARLRDSLEAMRRQQAEK